jgi:hypothetical protein
MDLRKIAHQWRCQVLPHAAPVLRRHCAVLLPRPSTSWLAEVQFRQGPYWAGHAAAHDLAPETYRARARLRLRHWVQHADVRLRVPEEVLAGVVLDGRCKSQFEVEASRGLFSPGQRRMLEWMTLGIPAGVRDRDRPVYGYLGGTWESGMVQQYGEVVLRLRPHVRWRATFCMGDSLDSALSNRDSLLGPTPVGLPSLVSADPRFDLLDIEDPWRAVGAPYHYIEAQIHGPVTVDEIGETVFTRGVLPSPDVQELLSSRGIAWRTVQGDGP